MIFIDTSFIIATVSKNDQWHEKALKLLPEVKKEERIISKLIISEIVSLIGVLHGGKAAVNVYNYIKDNHTIYKDKNLLDESIHNYLKYDGKLSLADISAITIMKELGIKKIASFDSDLDKTGVIRIG
ncbi:MAG: PIN domain-containing protein [Methanobrevibacter sp.]|nr:PIN domain-containing protein [Methanobrevibacter sp.]